MKFGTKFDIFKILLLSQKNNLRKMKFGMYIEKD